MSSELAREQIGKIANDMGQYVCPKSGNPSAPRSAVLGWVSALEALASPPMLKERGEDETIDSLRQDLSETSDAYQRAVERSADLLAEKEAAEANCATLQAEVDGLLARERQLIEHRYKIEAENATLQASLDAARKAHIDTTASLAAAVSLLERGGKKAAPSDKMFAQMLKDYNASLDRARAALSDPALK
jgi:septal ring factor EnvC (AmiA/AmiB activator)